MKQRGVAVYSVDLTTGACTSLLSPILPVGTATLHNVLEISPRGTILTAERAGGNATLYTADFVTGDVIPVGTNAVANLSAVSYMPVPEPTVGMGLVAGLVALAALAHRRRQ